ERRPAPARRAGAPASQGCSRWVRASTRTAPAVPVAIPQSVAASTSATLYTLLLRTPDNPRVHRTSAARATAPASAATVAAVRGRVTRPAKRAGATGRSIAAPGIRPAAGHAAAPIARPTPATTRNAKRAPTPGTTAKLVASAPTAPPSVFQP